MSGRPYQDQLSCGNPRPDTSHSPTPYDRPMVKGGWRTVGFLGATAAVLGWELFASFDGDPGTSPWTDLIVAYIPVEITAAMIGALVAWLPIHFGVRYRRRARERRDEVDGER